MAHQILSQIEEIIKACILSKRSIERKEQFAKAGIDANNNLYDLLWKYIQEDNPKKCIRFSTFPKEFSNPNTKYDTPAGLYAYNLKYAIDTYFKNYNDWFKDMKNDDRENFSHIDYINSFLRSLPYATNTSDYPYVIFFDIKEDAHVVDPISFADNGEYEKLVESFYTFLKLSLEKEQATGWFFEDTTYGNKFNKSLEYVNRLSLEKKETLESNMMEDLIKSDNFFNTVISLYYKDKNLFEKEIKKYINFLFYDILTKNNYVKEHIADKDNYELARVWYLCGHFANSRNLDKSVAARFNTMLNKVCGINAIIDSGTGLIHPNEMSQVWVANSTYIDNVEIVKNTKNFDNRIQNKKNLSFFQFFYKTFEKDNFFNTIINYDYDDEQDFHVEVKSEKSQIVIIFKICIDNKKSYTTLTTIVNFLKNNQPNKLKTVVFFNYIITQNIINQMFANPNYKFKLNSNNFKKFITKSLNEIDNNENADVKEIITNNVKEIFGPI